MTANVPTTVLELPLQMEDVLPEGVTIQKRLKTKLRVQAGLDEIIQIQTAVQTGLKSDSINKTERKRFETAKAAVVEARETIEETTLDVRSMDLTQHPIGAAVPGMSKDEKADLRKSMEENGYFDEEPIIMFEGMILDGFHRYTTAAKVGVTPTFKDYKGEDPVGYVAARNVRGRRHLSDDQKSIVAGKLAELHAKREGVGKASEHAAKTSHITANRVARARRLLKVSSPLAEAVRTGEMSLIDAEKISHDESLVTMLEEGYDGKLADIVPEVHPQTAAQAKKVHLPMDVWQHAEMVFDSEGNELGEAYWREPEPEPEPLDDDEVNALIDKLEESTENTDKRSSVRKAMKELDNHQIDAIYQAFQGHAPAEDLDRNKINSQVAQDLVDWYSSSPVSSSEDGKGTGEEGDDSEEADEAGEE